MTLSYEHWITVWGGGEAKIAKNLPKNQGQPTTSLDSKDEIRLFSLENHRALKGHFKQSS